MCNLNIYDFSGFKYSRFSKNILQLVEAKSMFSIPQADIFEVGTKWQTEVKSQGSLSSRKPYLARRQDYFHIFRRPNLHKDSRHK